MNDDILIFNRKALNPPFIIVFSNDKGIQKNWFQDFWAKKFIPKFGALDVFSIEGRKGKMKNKVKQSRARC